MTRLPRVYLDHAATRFPKSEVVLDAMREYSRTDEAAGGRGVYRSSQNASAIVSRLRTELASWIDAESEQEISFHSSGTAALNTALFAYLRNGDHVVTTAAEHNSVLRPLHHMASEGRISWTVVPVDATGRVAADDVLQSVTSETKLVAVTHAANVNGCVQPVAEIGVRLHDRFKDTNKPAFLCDAAQTLGHLPLSVDDMSIDLLAAPGHKGGQGPLGTGFLYVRNSLHPKMRPFLYGGTGTQSESLEMPCDYPHAFEAGNQNTPALAGWLAGLQSSHQLRTEHDDRSECVNTALQQTANSLYEKLETIDGVRLVGKPATIQLPVASIAIEGMQCSDVAMILDTEFHIEVRSGKHCAALIHDAIGSAPDGTVRISCSDQTTEQELKQLEGALRAICSEY